jgi:hypothetical protein
MITDVNALEEIRESWAGVEALRARLQVSAFASIGMLGGVFPFALSNAAHNVPFIHAYSVLNDVLEQLANEGKITCESIFLGKLLKASKDVLPWKDFSLIDAGANRRNDLAHRGRLLERAECWKYIDAVKQELVSWNIVNAG